MSLDLVWTKSFRKIVPSEGSFNAQIACEIDICTLTSHQVLGQILDQIFDQVLGQILDQIFDQVFGQVLDQQIQCAVLLGQKIQCTVPLGQKKVTR